MAKRNSKEKRWRVDLESGRVIHSLVLEPNAVQALESLVQLSRSGELDPNLHAQISALLHLRLGDSSAAFETGGGGLPAGVRASALLAARKNAAAQKAAAGGAGNLSGIVDLLVGSEEAESSLSLCLIFLTPTPVSRPLSAAFRREEAKPSDFFPVFCAAGRNEGGVEPRWGVAELIRLGLDPSAPPQVAGAALAEAERMFPFSALTAKAQGLLYLRHHLYLKALIHLRRAEKLGRDPETTALVGVCLFNLDDRNAAARAFKKAAQLDPKNEMVSYCLQIQNQIQPLPISSTLETLTEFI